MSISIYNPYFYIIQHISSGQYYAGVKYSKNSNPNQLLKSGGYQTSSDIIKQIILEEGLESFIIRKIKVFDTGEEALDYEKRFLRRVNAAFNDNFLNRSNNSLNTLNIDWGKYKNTCLEKFGVENPSQSEEVKKKKKQTCLKNHGVENPSQSKEIREKIKQTCLENLDVENPMQSDEVKEKHKHTCIKNYGVEFPSQSEDVKEKKKQTWLKNLGVEHPSQSQEVKEKMKQTNLDNLGVEFPSQSPEVQEKKRQNRIALFNRPTVLEIRKYKDYFKLKLGYNWFWKSQEVLDIILAEIKITYQEI